MARLNQEQRADIRQYARQLVSSGVSRRHMDTILREYSLEKYGISQSIGKTMHSRLFQQRVTEVREREKAVIKGYISPTKKRQSNYNKLISQHFLPAEARLIISRINKVNSNEILAMAEQRKLLYDRFIRKATEKGYSRSRFDAEWKEIVKNFYITNRSKWIKDWLTFHRRKGDIIKRGRKMGYDAIWDWYGFVKEQLPPDMQTDTPRKHRRKPQKTLTAGDFIMSKHQRREQRIGNLQTQLDNEADPAARAWLEELIEKERHKR